jgi:hypothetical protein
MVEYDGYIHTLICEKMVKYESGWAMILLVTSAIIFNCIAFKTIKGMSGNIILLVWLFTMVFQINYDILISLKFHAYWYFTQGIDYQSFIAYSVLVPPVNIMFLNWFPFNRSIMRKIGYFAVWEIVLLSYERLTMMQEPWGYFHYGWWTLYYSAIVNPILLLILLWYYRWINKLENKVRTDVHSDMKG